MSSKLNTAIAVAGIDIGENSFHVEVEDVKGTVAAFDFAIAVIGTVPLVENFDDLDPMSLQTKRMGDLNPSVLARLDLDAHVSASAAGQALSKRCRHEC